MSKDTPGYSRDRPSVLVVGAASRDIAAADPRGWRLGGAVTYGSLTLARLGLRVHTLFGADADALDAWELSLLREAGVDLRLVPLAHGPVFENIERPEGRIQTCLSASDPVPVEALPDTWGGEDALLLASVADELPLAWAEVASATSLVGLVWQGMLRRLVASEYVQRLAPQPTPLVRAAHLVALSVHDVGADASLDDLLSMLRADATLALTNGATGGFLVTRLDAVPRHRIRPYPAIPPTRVVDPTGAGDVFLATLFGAALLRGRTGPGPITFGGDALRLAAAAGSLAVEADGVGGVASLAAIVERAGAAVAPTTLGRVLGET